MSPLESRMVLPQLSDSKSARSLASFSMASASLNKSRPRSAASIFFQAFDSSALRAALTARSMSAASPSATWQIVPPVAGLMAGNVFPETLSCHLPPIKSGWSFTCGALIVFGLLATAVLMMVSFEIDCDASLISPRHLAHGAEIGEPGASTTEVVRHHRVLFGH